MSGDAHLPGRFAPEERTFRAMLTRQAGLHGDRPLFRCREVAWSYAETLHATRRMAGALAATGIVRGDRVAVLSTNRPEMMLVMLGAFWLGAVAVPLNVAAKPPQIRYALANSGARLLVVEDALAASIAATDLDGLALEAISVIGEMPAGLARPAARFTSDGPAIDAAAVGPGDTMVMLYTSGTTGPPKGVLCPNAQFYWWGAHTTRFLGIGRHEVLCSSLPLFHTNALNTLFQAMLTGSAYVLLPRFSASRYFEAMIGAEATVGYLLGAMVPMLLAQEPRQAERAHGIRTILAPGVPEAAHEAFYARTGIRLADGFGSTETNFVIGTTAGARVAGRIGRLAPGFSAIVADADDCPLPDGQAGELLLRADEPFAFATGYFANAEAAVAANRNLWFHTGDRVVRHTDGNYAFIDRIKDSIRRRGENISSFEIEEVLARHPAVAEVAAYGVPSALGEDEVMVSIVAREGHVVDFAALALHCAAHLPRYAVPRYFAATAELPRTENGKIKKYALKAAGITAGCWDREEAVAR